MDERVYRMMLRLYPAEFRREYAERLMELYRYRREDARRRGGILWRARFWWFITTDLARSVWGERTNPGAGVPDPVRPASRLNGGSGMEGLMQDVRYSIRRLVRSPGFSFSALAILTLGIGVNSSAFSVVNALLFQPPPFEEPERLVEILQDSDGGDPNSTSFPAFYDIAEHTEVFSGTAARAGGELSLDLDGTVLPVAIEYATSGYLPVLGLEPSRGRWFDASEDHLGGEPVAVVSHRFWRNRLGLDPEVLGKVVRLNGGSVTIVGVGPEGYNGGFGIATGDFWISISAMRQVGGPARSITRREDHPLRVVARLAPGVTRGAAMEAMDALSERLAAEFPDINRNRRIHVLPMATIGAERRGSVVPVAGAVMLIVGLVLLVASINLANLLLVRGMSRGREIGVRLALGGSRARLVRVLFGEVAILSVVGAALGYGLARALMGALARTQVSVFGPTTLDVRMDGTVLLFTLVAAGAASLIAGLAPALRATAPGATAMLQERTEQILRRRMGLAGLLVSAQVAVSVVLLVTAGLFIDRVLGAQSSDPGFDTTDLAMMRTWFGPLNASRAELTDLYDRYEERLEEIPGVRAAAFAYQVPFGYRGTTTLLLGNLVDGRRRPVEVPWNVVSSDYFETLGVRLLHGRLFDRRDGPDDPQRAVVSEAMAVAFWGRSDIVGESYVSENSPDEPVEIIGVVSDVKLQSLDEPARPSLYWSFNQGGSQTMTAIVRTDGAPGVALGSMREVVRELDSRIPVLSATTMESFMGETLARQRMTGAIMTLIGLFGLALATLGIYAVVSFGVTQRLTEVGIRLALGAERSSVVRLFLGDSARVIGLGAAAGLGLAWPVGRLVGSIFTGSGGIPMSVFGASLGTLGIAAVLATSLPARRASRLDPMLTLRRE